MKILVFGKTGQVATELAKRADVIAIGRDQADFSDPEAVISIVETTDADVIINAVANGNRCGGAEYPVIAYFHGLCFRRRRHGCVETNGRHRTVECIWANKADG